MILVLIFLPASFAHGGVTTEETEYSSVIKVSTLKPSRRTAWFWLHP